MKYPSLHDEHIFTEKHIKQPAGQAEQFPLS